MNGFSCVLMGLYLIFNPWSSELSNGINFIQLHPTILRDILIFSVTGSLGQLFIFYMLQRFGSLSLVTVTVTRKMFSILLSVFLFGHSIGMSQWGSVGVVFLGIGLDAYYSRKEKLASSRKDDTKKVKSILKEKIDFNDGDLKEKTVTPSQSPHKSPKKNNIKDSPLGEYIIESKGTNRRRSARLKALKN